MSAHPDAPQTSQQRWAIRRSLGRPVNGSTSYIRADTRRMETVATSLADPLLQLYSVRRDSGAGGWAGAHYAAMRRDAMAPVRLGRLDYLAECARFVSDVRKTRAMLAQAAEA